MNVYNPALEDFVDGDDFGPEDPCIWVVYPSGCAGDLLASIINFHYIETGARYKGITDSGRVIFRSSDMKISNQRALKNQLKFDDQFFFDIADSLSQRHLNWSKMDNFIFANHCYADEYIKMILDKFSNCKIIRLLPRTEQEYAIVSWLNKFKNLSFETRPFVVPKDPDKEIECWTQWHNSKVLTVFFGDLVSQKKFKTMYQKIQNHLDFPGPMITYEFVQFWINQQHPEIKNHINWLAEC